MLGDHLSDGGWWNTFSNLINKYGIVPKSAMPETYQSDYSEDMNDIILDRLQAAVHEIHSNKSDVNKMQEIKNNTVKQIYNILVKFLGQPPENFTWSFTNEEDESVSIDNMNPMSFKELVMPDIDMNDFVVLTNIPDIDKYAFYKKYEVENTNNVVEGKNFTFVNLPIHELTKYAQKSIDNGLPVWFAGDITKDYHPVYSTLDKKMMNTDLLFGEAYKMNKGQKILYKNHEANHAMVLTGYNMKDGVVSSYQVENSHGYGNNEEVGHDGFLCMDSQWFEDHLFQIVIHKKFLSRNIMKIVNCSDVVKIDPWNSMAPALRVKNSFR
jgi:bleomycin hydrolase